MESLRQGHGSLERISQTLEPNCLTFDPAQGLWIHNPARYAQTPNPSQGGPRGEDPRQVASASANLIPGDPYLGPAQGKITVYEQRAKILYELDRAHNKVAQHGA